MSITYIIFNMASSIIHICVSKEINKVLNKDIKQLYLGSIAPDISKLIGRNKVLSHFLDKNNSIPNLDTFLKKYKNNLDDSFVVGYYIHLYTDYIWFKFFIPEHINNSYIYDKNGNKLLLTEEEQKKFIYNDYTNLNIRLIEEYNLDLSLFYEQYIKPKDIIKEIPMDKLEMIIDQAGIIIENSKKEKLYIFDIKEINRFIGKCYEEILSNLYDIGYLKKT